MSDPRDDEILDLVDDGPESGRAFPDTDPYAGIDDDAALWREYREWLALDAARDLARGDDAPPIALLLAWAKASLPGPVCPCCCTDHSCLRCRVAALVGNP
jgi:hypothetical protein